MDTCVTSAKAAAKRKVKKWIEVSTAQVYDSDKKHSTESSPTKPWTKLAEFKLQAEEAIKSIPGLNWIIVRPAIVYGPGDISGLTHRLVCASVYKQLGETMEFLWDKDLKYNTVHVQDTVAALWFLAQQGNVGEIYNLADQGDTNLGAVAEFITKMFGIKTNFMGFLQSKAISVIGMKNAAETANEKHLSPWSELCKSHNIHNSPLTPYLDQELLYNDNYSVDGTKITKLGFSYKYPQVTEEELRKIINYFINLKYFPSGLI